MTDKLNEQVSALLDNELSDAEATTVLSRLSQDQDLRNKWERYHLIGDVMRGEPVHINADVISGRVKQLVDSEPAIISIPKKSRTGSWRSNWAKPAAGAALAASVAAVAVITAPGFLGLEEQAQPKFTAANINPVTTVAHQTISGTRWKNLKEPSLESRLNGYLVDHSEHAAPRTGIGMMPYATFVGYDSKR